ncbi:MAG: DUF4143 domain-containing protein [Alphaproteobacteria bacterium]|nr:DUF4143 domain-containing protein [Alphaproteobacteria bacterium]
MGFDDDHRIWPPSLKKARAGGSGPHGRAIWNCWLLVRRLAPFHANIGKRLVKSPRIYVRDSGLVHAFMGLSRSSATRSPERALRVSPLRSVFLPAGGRPSAFFPQLSREPRLICC